jgi:hypothetical protein
MITTFQLNSLTDDEFCILWYVTQLPETSKLYDFCYLKKHWVAHQFNQFESKVKPEFKELFENTKNKILK